MTSSVTRIILFALTYLINFYCLLFVFQNKIRITKSCPVFFDFQAMRVERKVRRRGCINAVNRVMIMLNFFGATYICSISIFLLTERNNRAWEQGLLEILQLRYQILGFN